MTTAPHLDRFVPGHVLARLERSDGLVTQVEGTLCFIDISGFTALSERLAAKGRVGAEELTEVLGRVFGEMLELVAERGGTLLKFGGDALLILFEGPEHAMQAACAAVEMRAALRKATEIPTSVGKVALKMSVGLHSGSVHLFRLSGTHRELIVAGPAPSHVNLMEGTADAGEILVSSDTRDLLPPGAATVAKGDGWLLKWRASKAAACGIPIHFDDGIEIPGEYVPTALRAHLEAGVTDSEHRMATVVFVKVLGIDDHIDDVGPDVTARALQELVANITTIADEQEVTFLATDVDANSFKVILVAGVPTTSMDENGKALRAARSISDLTTPFDLKIGVNRGHVFSGEIGSTERSTYTIMGDTVNLAARLMAAAPAGSVYASPEVVNGSTTLFATESVEPFHVKGKSQPVHALSLGDETGTRTAREAQTLPFVGRDTILGEVRSAVDAVADGTGGALAVTGPSGIGKTRTVDEALTETSVEVIEVRAEPYGAANPYRPFRDPAREFLGIERADNDTMAGKLLETLRDVAPDVVPLAPLLGDIAQVDLPDTPESRAIDPQFRQDRAIDLFVTVLEAVRVEPLIIVGEDMHWADAASEALIARLAKEAHSHPWLVIQTCRNLIQQDAVTTIVLDPLDDDTMRSLIHAATEAAPLHPDAVTAIVQRAGGSPLFAVELLKVVRDTGDVDSLPTSLDGIVGSQIDSLEPLSRRVLSYLAVLGRSFRVSVAREFLDSQGVDLDEATRSRLAEFLEEDGPNRLQFRHAMVRDTAYEGLSFRRRAALHLEAGEMVLDATEGSTDPVADILGLHFHLGGHHDRAWRYCCVAGDRMKERYANPEAAKQYERALESAAKVPSVSATDRRRVWVDLGEVRERTGAFDAAIEAFRQASRLARDDQVARIDVLVKRAAARERAGDYVQALRETTTAWKGAEALTGDDRDRLVARTLSLRAEVRLRQGKLNNARRNAALAAERADAVGDRRTLAKAYNVLAWAYVMSQDERAAELSERALELYETLGDIGGQSHMSNNLGFLAYFDGRWNDAVDHYERSRQAAERVGNVVDAAFAETNLGEVLVNQMRFDEADQRLVSAGRVLRATGEVSMATFAEVLLARVLIGRGELDAAEQLLEAVAEESRSIGITASAAEAQLYLAAVALERGDGETAIAYLDDAMSDAGEDAALYELTELRIRARSLGALGRVEEALELLDRGANDARAREQDYDLGMLTLVRAGMVGDDDVDEAARLRASAEELLAPLGIRI